MALAASLLEAAARGDHHQLARLLNAKSCPVDVVDENGCSALQRAAADGHVEAVQLLLQHGADPNKQDAIHGNTALHEAAWKGYARCVALQCGGGADARARNAAGSAPLHLACQNGHNQSCRELLLAGAPPDQRNNYGDTSLHTAARYGHAGVTRILISAQCKVSEQNKNGDTALHIAAAMGRRKLTRILLEAGCDKQLQNQQNETARDIAQRKGLEEIINILNTPVSKRPKKKEKHRDKSKERTIDEADAPNKPKDKPKDKKKKNVHFETPPPAKWSPYGCHYYPDTKFFPKPKLSSLPTEPLRKGEQYYLDLAGNIKKGPIGTGYTCYCAPFFKHMEEKMNEDKKDLKKHIDRAHERLDQKVSDLETKTQGQISELTRFVAAERALCKERHHHLEQWLTRGMFRASERVRRLDFSPRGSLDIPPMKRTRSLELLDINTEEWNTVHRIIKNFNENTDRYETNAKEPNDSKLTSKSTEMLDSGRRSPSPRLKYLLRNSKSSDQLDSTRSPHNPRSPQPGTSKHTSPMPEGQSHLHNVTAEIHVKANKISVSQSPVSVEGYHERYTCSSRQSNTKSPNSSNRQGSDYRASDSEGDGRLRSHLVVGPSPQNVPAWKSQVLQRTADDIRKRVLLEKEMSAITRGDAKSCLDISQDGYVKIPKQVTYHIDTPKAEGHVEREPRRSVQEIVAQVEQQQRRRCTSPEPAPPSRQGCPPGDPRGPSEAAMPQQPTRPAPILKEKPPKSKKFSLQNLIPFPTRKTFQSPPRECENDSESSDEEDRPIRTAAHPGPMRAADPPPPGPARSPIDLRALVPKDAYFHEIPDRRPRPYADSLARHNESGLPAAGSRTPLCDHTGVFDAMMRDHIAREMERIPHRDWEAEAPGGGGGRRPLLADHGLLASRLRSLATAARAPAGRAEREAHNDSGYSTKVYGSSQGPSPSLSGRADGSERAEAASLV